MLFGFCVGCVTLLRVWVGFWELSFWVGWGWCFLGVFGVCWDFLFCGLLCVACGYDVLVISIALPVGGFWFYVRVG